jgi:hypothetical protein
LAALIRDVWPKIAGKTMLQASELDQAETLADRIVTAVGHREQGPAVVATAAEDRQRAFTLFLNTYNQVRRAVHFLRWDQGDADAIVPSLYAVGRSARRKGEETEEPAPSANSTKPAVQPVVRKPDGRSATIGTGSVGMPDSEPFAPIDEQPSSWGDAAITPRQRGRNAASRIAKSACRIDRRTLFPRDPAFVRIVHTSWPGTEMAGRISTGSRQGQDRSAATRLAASSSADFSSSSMGFLARVSRQCTHRAAQRE